jgi:hypothetical protein
MEDTLRIGLIAPPWVTVPPPEYGGTELVIDHLARGLNELGHDVVLFTTGDATCPVPRRWAVSAVLANATLPVLLVPDCCRRERHRPITSRDLDAQVCAGDPAIPSAHCDVDEIWPDLQTAQRQHTDPFGQPRSHAYPSVRHVGFETEHRAHEQHRRRRRPRLR